MEAIESSELKSIMGVQWHPECLAEGDRLFGWLVTEAESYRKARGVHQRVLTLDSHCDTPMFFAAGADFGRRDPRLLVDLHKMGEGRQDAVVMVAYLPQPKPGECFQDLVGLKAEAPQGLRRHDIRPHRGHRGCQQRLRGHGPHAARAGRQQDGGTQVGDARHRERAGA